MRRMFVVAATTLLAAVLAGQASAAVKLGRSAPDLRGPDMAGRHVDIEDYRGKWVYLDFWATWCGPCMKALPEVVELSRRTRDRDDLVILGISLDDERTAAKLASVVSQAGITYPILFEGEGKNSVAADGWGVNAIPATFLIDPEGNIAGVDVPPGYVEQVLANRVAKPAAGKLSKPSKSGNRSVQQQEAPSSTDRVTDGLRATETFYPDSPSSGDPNVRDLEIRTSISTSAPLEKYRLSVVFAEPSGKKAKLARVWRYNLKLTQAPSGKAGLLTEISPAPGKIIGLDLASLTATKLPGKVDPKMPPISATYSPREHLHTIVVPVPDGITDLFYSLASFDEGSQQYVEGALVKVRI
jgi:peroxiredoxin